MNIFKKIRFYFRLYFAFLKKHKKNIFLGIIGGVLTFFFITKVWPLYFAKEVKRVGIVGKYNFQTLPLEIQKLISEGLVSVSFSGGINPNLAKGWDVDEGGKVYKIYLKEGVFWHDGKPLEATDINYNFADVAITVLDKLSLKFTLKEPFAPFLSLLSQPIFKDKLVGTGEYKVKRIKMNGNILEKLVLVSLKNKPKKEIIFRFYPSEESVKTAFKLGEVDEIRDIVNYSEFKNWKGIKINPEIKNNLFVALYFNTQNPKFADKSTRQALAYALKKEWKPRALSSYNPRSEFFNSGVKKYEFNLERAKELLKKNPQEIELATTPALLEIAERIKEDWQQLGIETKIKVISQLENNEALLITQEIPIDPDQYLMWHSTQKLNLSHFKNPRLDKLLEDGRRTLEKEKRKQIYFDFQKFLVEEVPAIFLFHPTLYTISRF